jgi:hypothetical protein
LLLCRRRDSSRYGQHLDAPVLVVTLQDRSNPLRVFVGPSRRGKNPEPGRQHILPVDSNIPRAAFVSEEEDLILTRVDLVKEAENNLEGLAYHARIFLLRLNHTPIKKAAAISNPSQRASRLVRAVLELTANAS